MWVGTPAALTDPTSDPGWATGVVSRGHAAPAVLGMAFPHGGNSESDHTPFSVLLSLLGGLKFPSTPLPVSALFS